MTHHLLLIRSAVLIVTLCLTSLSGRQFQQEQPLSRLTVRLRAILRGHTKSIERIAFSPDGKLIATSSEDFTVRIWDTYTGELKVVLSGEGKAKWEQERWYYNWQYITAREFPGIVTGHLKQVLHDGAYRLALSPDKRLMVTVRTKDPHAFKRHELLELWDVATGECKLTFAEIPVGISAVHWSTDGKSIIVEGSGRTKARLMDVVTGRVKATLPYETCTTDSWFGDAECAPFTFNSDGSVVTKERAPLKLWSTDNGGLLAELKDGRPPMRFSPTDNQLLVTRGKDKKTALVWELTLNKN
jgi:WD40 repeat protein